MSAPDANDIARKKGPAALRSVIDGGDRTSPRFTLTPFSGITLDTTRINYLIKGLLPRTGLVVIWGPPKCGKSFWALDLAMHVALGSPYRGRRTRQGAVIYLALEGAEGFKARAEAIRNHYRVSDAPFYLMTVRIDLVRDYAQLVADIRKQLGAVIPAAVFIDTLNRSLIGSEAKD
jgi:RecA-family ATPase